MNIALCVNHTDTSNYKLPFNHFVNHTNDFNSQVYSTFYFIYYSLILEKNILGLFINICYNLYMDLG